MDAMFDIGFGEMILLAAIALIAIGPKQLPEVARAVGKLLGEVKKTMGEVTSTVANAREETDRAIRKVTSDLTDITDGINKDVARNMESIQQELDARPIRKDPPSPIVTLADHPGDPPWVVNPDIPKPEEVVRAEQEAAAKSANAASVAPAAPTSIETPAPVAVAPTAVKDTTVKPGGSST